MSNPFKDRLQRLHGARRRANERAESNETTGTFHAREAREFEDLDEERGPLEERPGRGDQRESPVPKDLWLDHDHPKDDNYGQFLLAQAIEERFDALFDEFADGPTPEDPRSIAFLDTETTGLSDSDYAFCAGLGFWSDDAFRVRIFHMRSEDDEPAMLRALTDQVEEASGLCTFNGRSFDLPLLERRYARHDLPAPFDELAHLDLLPAAQNIFSDLDSHKLTVLEDQRLQAPRKDDLPGREAPRRWSRFLQTGRFSLLQDVFDHNRRDILALVALLPALSGRAGRAETTRTGPGSRRDAGDAPTDQRGRNGDSAPSFEPEEGSVGSRLKRSLAARKRSNRGTKKRSESKTSTNAGGSTPSDNQRSGSEGSAGHRTHRRWSLSGGKKGGETEREERKSSRNAAPGERLQQLRKEADDLLGTDPDAAVAKLHEIVALSPQHAWALERLVRLHRQRGQSRLASHYEERLRDAAPF